MILGNRKLIKHRSSGKGSDRLLILSDLHIWGVADPLHRAFLRFLQEELHEGDTLFLVGDLFDVFLGNKEVFTSKYEDLIRALRGVASSKNIHVYYTEGNHDFYLKNLFYHDANIHILDDDYEYHWNGKTFLFSHGDKVNPKDYSYKVYKALLNNFLTKNLITAIPGSVIDDVGSKMSSTSRKYHPEATSDVIHMFRNFACEHITRGVDYVILGHSHALDDIKFKVGDHEGQYLNVGFPRKDMVFGEITTQDDFIKLSSWAHLIAPHKVDSI